MTRKHFLFAGAGLLGLFASGCVEEAYLEDDLGGSPSGVGSLSIGPVFTPGKDALHLPYALGTRVRLTAENNAPGGDEDGWTVTSRDDTILELQGAASDSSEFIARQVGTTVVDVRDEDGDRVHSVNIEIVAATRLELYAVGALLVGRGWDETRVTEPRVFEGGEATFLVGYFNGERRIWGQDILASLTVDSAVATSSGREWRGNDLLQVQGVSAGQTELAMEPGPTSVPLTIVTAGSASSLEVVGESSAGRDSDSRLLVWASSRDAEGEAIYGGQYDWSVGGVSLEGQGDLLRYPLGGDDVRVAEASGPGGAATIDIHTDELGEVRSTNDLDCSGAPGTGGAIGFALLFLLLLRARRR